MTTGNGESEAEVEPAAGISEETWKLSSSGSLTLALAQVNSAGKLGNFSPSGERLSLFSLPQSKRCVSWLHTSPGPFFRSPDSLLPPLRCSGSWTLRGAPGPRTQQASGRDAASCWEGAPGEGLVGPSLRFSVLTSVPPIPELRRPCTPTSLLGLPRTLQEPQTAQAQAHRGPFSPGPLSWCLPPRPSQGPGSPSLHCAFSLPHAQLVTKACG